MGVLLQTVCQLDRLHRAWTAVRCAVRDSAWAGLQEERAAVEAAPLRTLEQLRRRLSTGDYTFAGKWSYTKRKSGGSRRGITVHGLLDRVVQRALLDLFYSRDPAVRERLGAVARTLDRPSSFAGVPGRGVPEAIGRTVEAIRQGARYYALSDVKDFFPRVPRGEVVEFVAESTGEPEFVELFRRSLDVELLDPSAVANWLDLFPLGDVGVAQGSLLSVLVGNLALRHFDARLEREGLVAVRYLDDFCLLGAERANVEAGFAAAEEELARIGMTCYAPGDGSQKGAAGATARGFEFLGCRVHPSGVSPAPKAQRRLLEAVDRTLDEGRAAIEGWERAEVRRRAEPAYAQTLARVDRLVRGWGDAYRFVSNRVVFAQLDRQLDRRLTRFRRWFVERWAERSPAEKRRMLGVALLQDTPPRPPQPPST